MASATGIRETTRTFGQDEPLLGRPGDVSQTSEQSLLHNLILGTAIIAQGGIWILVAITWGAVFTHDVILFSAHPLLNSAGLLLVTEAVLVLQPTHTAVQKKQGAYAHAALNDVGIAALIAGFVIIEYNKISHNGPHFVSLHGILGFVTYILMFVQALVGFTMYFVPQAYGSVEKAKSIWKYHRMSGYVVLTLLLATVCAATQTTYNLGVLGMQLWAVFVASVLVLVGIVPRIKKNKLGL